MAKKSIPKPWRVSDVTFVEIEITHRTDRQLRVEFECGLRVVVADDSQIPLATRLIETRLVWGRVWFGVGPCI